MIQSVEFPSKETATQMSDTEKLSKFELELVHKLRGNPHLHDALNRIIAAHGAEPQQDKEEA